MTEKIDKRTKKVLLSLGDHIRRLRERLGMSQVQLARNMGMDPPNLAKIEQGDRNVTVDTLVRLAAGLDVELSVRLHAPRSNASTTPATMAKPAPTPALVHEGKGKRRTQSRRR